MSIKKRIGVVVGTRPNFIKAVCLLDELESNKDLFDVIFINTGQHYDSRMAGIFFDELNIRDPDIQLSVAGKSHANTISNSLFELKNFLNQYRLDYLIVFGDVNSTLSAAVSAAKTGTKLIHIESGLRSRDRRMPEELNRVVTDHISDLLFVSEPSGIANLEEEGVSSDKVHFVGNIMIDTLVKYKPNFIQRESYKKFNSNSKDYLLLTLHRQENVDNPHVLENILKTFSELSKKYTLIWPLHPRTKLAISKFGFDAYLEGIKLIEPLGYLDFMNCIFNAKAILTDSGGIQEETSYLEIPCITLRDNTERPLTIDKGTNILVDVQNENLTQTIESLLSQPKEKSGDLELWDGNTSKRIVAVLKKI